MSPHTGSPDIDNSSPVGKGSPFISDGGSTDGDDRGGTGRGGVSSVNVVIPGGNDGGNTGGDEVGGGIVGGSHEATVQAQGSNRRATAAFSCTRDPFYSGNAAGDVSANPGP